MWWKQLSWPKRILAGVLALLLAIQLVPVWLWQTNPPVQAEPAWDRPETRALAQRACFDCHSNETNWPLYSRVAPVSWLVTNHVVEGRSKLNFSEWRLKVGGETGVALALGSGGERGEGGRGGREKDPAEEAAEEIKKGKMPTSDYLLLHPEARLTDAEKQQLIQGLQASLR